MLNTLLLIGGLALILAGANGLTDGSAAVAKRFRISDLVIGLTIVAFGTSAPELVISVLSALNGSAEMAIGNVVGSNIFNALMIIGCTALVLPIKVGEGTMSKEIPLVILSSLVLFVCANDMMLDREAVNVISRSDGFVLLAFFLIFMRYTFAIARNGADEAGEEQKIKEMPVWKSVLYIAGGLAGLIFGGQLFVDGASGLARSLLLCSPSTQRTASATLLLPLPFGPTMPVIPLWNSNRILLANDLKPCISILFKYIPTPAVF